MLQPLAPNVRHLFDKDKKYSLKLLLKKQYSTHFPQESVNSLWQNPLNSQNRLWVCLNLEGKKDKF